MTYRIRIESRRKPTQIIAPWSFPALETENDLDKSLIMETVQQENIQKSLNCSFVLDQQSKLHKSNDMTNWKNNGQAKKVKVQINNINSTSLVKKSKGKYQKAVNNENIFVKKSKYCIRPNIVRLIDMKNQNFMEKCNPSHNFINSKFQIRPKTCRKYQQFTYVPSITVQNKMSCSLYDKRRSSTGSRQRRNLTQKMSLVLQLF